MATNKTTNKATKRSIYRQGDVLFERIDALPAGTSERTSRVLVEGEVTGHAHRVADASHASVHVIDGTQLMYLHCEAATAIVHEEHATITLPEGIYSVTVQREYSPQEIRRVVD